MNATEITLYCLGGGVALAALVFVVMLVVTAFRAPRLPDLSTFEPMPLPSAPAPKPQPLPLAAALVALEALPADDDVAPTPTRQDPPRTVIALPPIAGIAPATRARTPSAFAIPPLRLPRGTTPPPVADRLTATGPTWEVPVRPMARSTVPAAQPAPRALTAATSTAMAPVVAVTASAPAAHVVTVAAAAPVAPVVLPSVARANEPAARPSPISWTPPPRVAPRSPATAPKLDHVRRPRPSMPTMPSKPGKLRTVLGGFVAVIMLAATPVVVEPSLIDPLCDDYVWDGAEAAAIVRGYAREANVAIDLGEVLNAPLEKLDASSVP